MIDPLITKLIAISFALLLLGAAWHKLAAPSAFRAILADYQLLPTFTLTIVTWLVPFLEASLAFAWIAGFESVNVAIASASLMALYALAIAINLLRGRVHIGCGCGFSIQAEDQPLSWLLVVRNIFLIAISLVTLLPAIDRELHITDYLVLCISIIVVLLLQSAVSQLLRNGSAIGSWRDSYE
jgi:hypothetical protein